MTDRDCVPIECLQTNRLQLVPLLPPGPQVGVLESKTVRDFVLLLGHISPRPPDDLFLPIVREVVNVATWKGLEVSVIASRACPCGHLALGSCLQRG